jgi:hypothetical protein
VKNTPKQTPGLDEEPKTVEMPPEGAAHESMPEKAAPTPKKAREGSRVKKAALTLAEPRRNPLPPFEIVDPQVFATDPAAAAAAVEQNTSTFFSDLEKLRLEESETQGLSVGPEILIRVPVRRPGRKEFFRCHPGPHMATAMALYVDDSEDGDGEAYPVTREMREVFGEDVKPTLVQLTMLRNGTVILWPLKIPQADGGRGRSWHESALLARDIAMTKWIKLQSDHSLSGYRMFAAQGHIPEPQWPDRTLEEYLEIAFRDRIVKSMDHPIVRKYLGL